MQLADRRFTIDSSGIRKVFDLAASLKNPCNLSIGLPDYDVPDAVKESAFDAIRAGHNRYTVTAGVPELRGRILSMYRDRGQNFDDSIVVSGTSGGLLLTFSALLNPGDEMMITDPYFVMYKHLCNFIGGVPKYIDTYPDFRLRREALEAAWSPKCKLLVINSPNNPTGAVYSREELKMAAEFAAEKNLTVLSDEIYESFVYDEDFASIADYTDPENTIVISGLSKSVARTGWRLGWAVGPKDFIKALTEIQQYTFVCAPAPAQQMAFTAMDFDMSEYMALFKKRRDLIADGLTELGFEVERSRGAFYIFPKAPWGTGEEFVRRCVENELLVVPGNIFSEQNTHFRISFAASTEQLERGLGILKELREPAAV